MIELEIWKIYKRTIYHGQERLYEISDHGNMKINGILVDLSKLEHQNYYHKSGIFIHRAVAELFIPNPDNKPCVDHIDTNKHNNNIDNLRWVTYSENMLNPITNKYMSDCQKGKPKHKLFSEIMSKSRLRYYSEHECCNKGRTAYNKNKHRVYDIEGNYHYE